MLYRVYNGVLGRRRPHRRQVGLDPLGHAPEQVVAECGGLAFGVDLADDLAGGVVYVGLGTKVRIVGGGLWPRMS